MPILSQVGTDRADYVKKINQYLNEFETIGCKAISSVPAHNVNVKLNMVTEAFFNGMLPNYNINDAEHYGRIAMKKKPTLERVLNILKMPESREIFGLTFKDLINLDDDSLTYITNQVRDIYEQKQAIQKREESKLT